MRKFNKMGIEDLQVLVSYVLEKRNDIAYLISAFGKVASNNGHGTVFLTPTDPIFKVVWIYEKNGKVETVGLGGQFWTLKLSDLLAFYKRYTESFSRYDDEYVYVFFRNEECSHAIKISSKDPLLQEGKVLSDINVSAVNILLK